MNNLKRCVAALLLIGIGSWSGAFAQEQDSLVRYIKVAIENNPGVKAQKHAHGAFLEKIQQAGAIEDPELTVGAYTSSMDIVGGRSLANASLMQPLPWFGARKAAREEATHLANVQDQQFHQLVDHIAFQVSSQWFSLQKLNEQLRNQQQNKDLMEQLEQLATRKYSSAAGIASGGMSEVLRVQLEVVELENQIENTKSMMQAEKAAFNALLNREPTAEIVLGPEIRKEYFMQSEKEILAAIEANNPNLGMIKEEGLAYKAKAEKDRKMSKPKIGVGLEYMLIGKTDNPMLAMGSMNGKDMLMPMVSVSLPIFRKKYNAQQRESEQWWLASNQRLTEAHNALKSEYYGLKSQLGNYERALELNEKQSSLAETTYQLVLKEFVSGKSDLTDVIEVQRLLLGYRLQRAEILSDFNVTVFSIKKLIAEQP